VDRRRIVGPLIGGQGGRLSARGSGVVHGGDGIGQNAGVRVTAKVDYAVRAGIHLARAAAAGERAVKGDRIAEAQSIPVNFLENILAELRQSGIVRSQRGSDGGYWLHLPAEDVSVADIIRAVEGPLATVRGSRAEELDYPEGVEGLQELWVAVRASLRSVLENVTLADLAEGHLPAAFRELTDDPDAWQAH
jgi:Rrf2 family protein